MSTLKTRIGKVEAQLSETRNGPLEFAVINVDAPDADERLKRAMRQYKARYGGLSGLRVIRTHVPEPMPLPAAFKKI